MTEMVTSLVCFWEGKLHSTPVEIQVLATSPEGISSPVSEPIAVAPYQRPPFPPPQQHSHTVTSHKGPMSSLSDPIAMGHSFSQSWPQPPIHIGSPAQVPTSQVAQPPICVDGPAASRGSTPDPNIIHSPALPGLLVSPSAIAPSDVLAPIVSVAAVPSSASFFPVVWPVEGTAEAPGRPCEKPCSPKSLLTADFYCGAGGLSKGFLDAGFEIILGVDTNLHSCNTWQVCMLCFQIFFDLCKHLMSCDSF